MSDIVTNSKARRDYHILETYEAGLVLRGSEVKSIRAGKVQIADAFAKVDKGQVWLHNAHIDEYVFATHEIHVPKAPRKLLLNKPEIRKLAELATVKGNALIPLSLYWKGDRVKLQLGVCKGKAEYDKRQDIRKREDEREMRRASATIRRK
jgi:SsrA-binding protein